MTLKNYYMSKYRLLFVIIYLLLKTYKKNISEFYIYFTF